ncbi:MAG: methylated-DNA--[protein]-cysteine S-methyltransferase [bacterium]
MSEVFQQASLDYQRIEQAIQYLEQNFHRHPTLQEIARTVHVSEYHFQRLFSRWVGISPKRFLQFLTKEYAKELLRQSRDLLDVTYQSGLSSPGRLHDLFVACEAVTPGEYKSRGEALTIEFGVHPTPFGECLLSLTERGICGLDFIKSSRPEAELDSTRKKWREANFVENRARTGHLVQQIFDAPDRGRKVPFHVFLKGTNFQVKVWEALLKIPYARVVSYHDIAYEIGQPGAVRAVANAIGRNPVPFLIPCHRVIRKLGEFGGYGGGRARKKAIIGWEVAKATNSGV